MASRPQGIDTDGLDSLRDGTARLDAAIENALVDGGHDAFAAPALLPGWTIGHVVTHLARNADGLRRVLVGAKVGEQLQPYASPQARADDIEAGAHRSTETIATDYRQAGRQLMETIESLPPAVWQSSVDLGRGGPTTADVIVAARLGEVELHHHDLGVDGGLALLDGTQALHLLRAVLRSYVRTREVPAMKLQPTGAELIVIRDGEQVIAGSATDLVSWLSGRGDGSTLRTTGGLPELPSW
ncbi:MAG: maleylpyruvate isomerase family mycothiol-dependent enzyme [Nakamurella sp.]